MHPPRRPSRPTRQELLEDLADDIEAGGCIDPHEIEAQRAFWDELQEAFRRDPKKLH